MALTTPFNKPVMSTPGLGGDSITGRGSDPQVSTSGSSGLSTTYDKAIVDTPSGEESANSVSGLPSTPNRFQPSEAPPEIPSLKDRSPGTIDKQ